MKLIIDIPDSDYERIKDLVANDTGYTMATTIGTAYQVIANGIPYKEIQHGDLISREALKEELSKRLWFVSSPQVEAQTIKDIIDDAPAVEPRIEYGTDGQP